jgi:hypothetical protein
MPERHANVLRVIGAPTVRFLSRDCGFGMTHQ